MDFYTSCNNVWLKAVKKFGTFLQNKPCLEINEIDNVLDKSSSPAKDKFKENEIDFEPWKLETRDKKYPVFDSPQSKGLTINQKIF